MGERFRVMMGFQEFNNTNFDLDLRWIYDLTMLQFFFLLTMPIEDMDLKQFRRSETVRIVYITF